jgi:hypothetical protein
LSDGDAPKQFKLNLISDRHPNEDEFAYLRKNQKLNLSQDYVKAKLKELAAAQKFLYDAEKLQKHV